MDTGLEALLPAKELEQPHWSWIIDPKNIPPGVKKMWLTMSDTPLLGKTFTEEMERDENARFAQFRHHLRSFQSPLTGAILQPVGQQSAPSSSPTLGKAHGGDDDVILGISPSLIDLKNTLEKFMGQTFMAVPEERYLQTQIPLDMQLSWRISPLQDALVVNESFNQYMKNEMVKVNRRLQPVLRKAAQVQLSQHLASAVAWAQQLKPQTATLNQAEEVLRNDIQNFASAVPLLDQITSGLKGLSTELESKSSDLEMRAPGWHRAGVQIFRFGRV
jgi:hypothetical protein